MFRFLLKTIIRNELMIVTMLLLSLVCQWLCWFDTIKEERCSVAGFTGDFIRQIL